PAHHRPFQAPPAVLDASPGEINQQRLAETVTSMRRSHIQILEIDAVAAAEGREIDEPRRKAHRLPMPFGEYAIKPWIVAEQRLRNHRLGRLDLVRQFFVCGEFSDERQN